MSLERQSILNPQKSAFPDSNRIFLNFTEFRFHSSKFLPFINLSITLLVVCLLPPTRGLFCLESILNLLLWISIIVNKNKMVLSFKNHVFNPNQVCFKVTKCFMLIQFIKNANPLSRVMLTKKVKKQIFKRNLGQKAFFRVDFDVLLLLTEFRTEPLVTSCYFI